MSDINKNLITNISGGKKLYYVFVENIISIPDASDHVITLENILMKSGEDWNEIYGTDFTISFNINTEDTAAGLIYNVNISLRHPKDQASITLLFEQLRRRPLVLRFIDKNNVQMLIGSINIPVYATYNIKKEGDPYAYNGYEINFKQQYTEPPYYLQ